MNKYKKFFKINLLVSLTLVIITTLVCIQTTYGQTVSFDFGKNVYGDSSSASRILQIILLITVLSIAPSLLLMVTSFTRFIIIFSLVRTALGTQQTPPTQVLVALALFLTIFTMQPVLEEAWNKGISPMIEGRIDEVEGVKKAVEPFREYMILNTRKKDLNLFVNIAKLDPKIKIKDAPIQIVIPAYMISEIKRGFEAGFLLFIPFLVIDMVVASVLMAMGMMMLPPVVISLPFKIVYFVLIDGWYMLSGSLIKTIYLPTFS